MKNIVMICAAAIVMAAFQASAEPSPVPKEALKALKIAKGKPCSKGVVFMDGKYIAPPYVVKRYGTALMINDVQVTAPLVPWEEFLKTQSGVTVTRTETPVQAAPEPVPAPEPEPEPSVESSDDDDPLADLFDDAPKAKKKPAAKKAAPRPKRPPKPVVTTSYSMEGEFVLNEASKAMLDKINRARTDVNARLLRDGFVFFGSNYSRVSGDNREMKRLLGVLPGMMSHCKDGASLFAEARKNGFYYITEAIADDLVRNRFLYPQLERRLQAIRDEEQYDSIMQGKVR